MKKVFLNICIALILCSVCFMTVSAGYETGAEETVVSRTVEYAEDGSYIEIIVVEENNGIMPLASTYTKSGTKYYNARNSDGDILWTFSLHGTFTVNPGVSATCTATSYSTSNIASGWSLDSASTSKSGNKAYGSATFKKKVLFVTTQTADCSIDLTCSSDGTLS